MLEIRVDPYVFTLLAYQIEFDLVVVLGKSFLNTTTLRFFFLFKYFEPLETSFYNNLKNIYKKY